MSSSYCDVCGAERRGGEACRFAVPEDRAPWIHEYTHGDPEARRDRQLRLQVARWLLHHPDRTRERDLKWARRIAGMSDDPEE